MNRNSIRRFALGSAVAALALGGLVPAQAQRDPAYEQARAAGQVGEKMDGYLGVVSGGAAVQKLVDDINIRRKAVYTERAQASGSTVQEYAFAAGCQAITRTQPGEKYQGTDGSWQTRGAGAPQRNANCP